MSSPSDEKLHENAVAALRRLGVRLPDEELREIAEGRRLLERWLLLARARA